MFIHPPAPPRGIEGRSPQTPCVASLRVIRIKGGHIDVNEYAAGVVFLTHLHVIKFARFPEILGAYRRHIHEVQPLAFPAEIFPHLKIEAHSSVNVLLYKGVFNSNILQFSGESSVTAMIAPIGVENPELCLIGIPTLSGEIGSHFLEVVLIHGESHLLPVGCEIIIGHIPESL